VERVKVSVRAHGGQAAALRAGRPATAVDSTSLYGDQARELAELTAAALAEPSAAAAPDRSRDAMSYTIEVDDGDRVVALRRSDTAMSPAFAALLSWLRAHGSPPPL
jgi:hypothetical protein